MFKFDLIMSTWFQFSFGMRIYRQRCSNLTGSLPPRPCVYMDSISTWTKITTACSVKRSWPGRGQEPAKHFKKTAGNFGLKVLVFHENIQCLLNNVCQNVLVIATKKVHVLHCRNCEKFFTYKCFVPGMEQVPSLRCF